MEPVAIRRGLAVRQQLVHRAYVAGEAGPRLCRECLGFSFALFRVAPQPRHDAGQNVHLVGTGGLVVLVDGHWGGVFTAYSIFTVRTVVWGAGGAPHRIELDAASDNQAAAEGGYGRWATPAGSEELPLAPWS